MTKSKQACTEREEIQYFLQSATVKSRSDSYWRCRSALPVRMVLWRPSRLKLSMRGVRIPCMVPNMVLRPRLSSMRKNSVDQKGLAGKRAITSVKAMNARPVPSTPCEATRTECQKLRIRIERKKNYNFKSDSVR